MPIDPVVEQILRDMEEAGSLGVAGRTPEQARARPRPLRDLEPVAEVEDHSVPAPEGAVPVRLYRPEGEGPQPALVYFHGGGWVTGDLDSHDWLCRIIANRAGCTVIAVHYRLAPEHPFPAAVHDAFAAVRWAAREASRLRIDPERLAVGGDSAGANLGAVCCHLARQEGGPNLALQVLIYPVTDMSRTTDSHRRNAAGPLLSMADIQWFANHYLRSAEDVANPLVSPLLFADHGGLPPALVITAEFDPLCDEGRAYADRLAEAGVPVEYTDYPGMVHGFFSMYPRAAGAVQAIEQVCRFLRHGLHPQAA